MVAKGLDFPTVTLVGVVAADIGLHAPDFRAGERSFALIAQVCGRSGRARPGEAIVQTYSPAASGRSSLREHDYEGLPARVGGARGARLSAVAAPRLSRCHRPQPQRTRCAQARGTPSSSGEVEFAEVLGPAPYPIARLNNEWRFRIAIKTRKPAALRAAFGGTFFPSPVPTVDRVLPQRRSVIRGSLGFGFGFGLALRARPLRRS